MNSFNLVMILSGANSRPRPMAKPHTASDQPLPSTIAVNKEPNITISPKVVVITDLITLFIRRLWIWDLRPIFFFGDGSLEGHP